MEKLMIKETKKIVTVLEKPKTSFPLYRVVDDERNEFYINKDKVYKLEEKK